MFLEGRVNLSEETTVIDITKLKVGDKVCYQSSYYAQNKREKMKNV